LVAKLSLGRITARQFARLSIGEKLKQLGKQEFKFGKYESTSKLKAKRPKSEAS
jgi:hypothetical protein